MNQFLELSLGLLLTVWAETRFLIRTLGNRLPTVVTFICFLLASGMASFLNIAYSIVGTVPTNLIYYGLIHYVLFLLLFQGGLIKTAFFVTLLTCIPEMLIQIPLAFLYCDRITWGEEVLSGLGIVNTVLFYVFLEYAAHRFRNLKYELPARYTVYLMVVVIFVYFAVYAMFEWMLSMQNPAIMMAIGCAAFNVAGLAVIMVAIFALDRQVVIKLREQQYAIQVAHLKNQEVQWRQMAGFRHDLKNHLLCLNGLLAQEKLEQARTYMQTLSQTVSKLENQVQTGNDYADALLNAKYAVAQALNIQLSFQMPLPIRGYAEPEDLCCILSNAMDNAIEACSRIPQMEKRWIEACSFLAQGHLVIEIKNSLPDGVTVKNGQVHAPDGGPGHGFGLMNIRAAVEKYGGVLDLSCDNCFTLSVLLPSPVCDIKQPV